MAFAHTPDASITDAAPSAVEELKRGWRPLVACSIGIGLGLSPIPAYTAGIFASALEQDIGWPRSQILVTLTFIPVALISLGAIVGRLADRIGARKVAICSTIGLSLSFVLLATISRTIGHFYAAWGCLAVVSLGTLPTTYARVITGWFDRARGLALGIALAGTGVTGVLAPFYLNWVIGAYGWRVGYLAYGALPLVIALPVLIAWLKEPERASQAARASEAAGASVRAALHDYRFWALALAALGLAAGTSGLMPNLVPLLSEHGISKQSATTVMAAMAISVTGGRLLSGVLLDRLRAPFVALIVVTPAVLALAALAQPGIELTTGIACGVTIGLVAGAEFDLVAYLIGRYFGRRHFSELYSIQYAIFGLGAGFAPAVYGGLRDRMGSYDMTIVTSAVLFVCSIAAFFTLGRYPAHGDAIFAE
ncbi:MFS transporter [Novosphingobium sp. 9U]|uniref:MFS transporter n=1 Tax=Novosphingobium sp. 9U TaxID=2653158 RepID=UPI0012F0C762|nr:MFS transporter [Novosphingobium sp. 9U]VWX55193.1 Major facilitator superfamily protein [Novosphingobium sp. 9U]